MRIHTALAALALLLTASMLQLPAVAQADTHTQLRLRVVDQTQSALSTATVTLYTLDGNPGVTVTTDEYRRRRIPIRTGGNGADSCGVPRLRAVHREDHARARRQCADRDAAHRSTEVRGHCDGASDHGRQRLVGGAIGRGWLQGRPPHSCVRSASGWLRHHHVGSTPKPGPLPSRSSSRPDRCSINTDTSASAIGRSWRATPSSIPPA